MVWTVDMYLYIVLLPSANVVANVKIEFTPKRLPFISTSSFKLYLINLCCLFVARHFSHELGLPQNAIVECRPKICLIWSIQMLPSHRNVSDNTEHFNMCSVLESMNVIHVRLY